MRRQFFLLGPGTGAGIKGVDLYVMYASETHTRARTAQKMDVGGFTRTI